MSLDSKPITWRQMRYLDMELDCWMTKLSVLVPNKRRGDYDLFWTKLPYPLKIKERDAARDQLADRAEAGEPPGYKELIRVKDEG